MRADTHNVALDDLMSGILLCIRKVMLDCKKLFAHQDHDNCSGGGYFFK